MISRQNFPITPISIFTSIWQNRQLFFQMTYREITSRYRGSFIGLAWSFITPLLTLVIYTFVFSTVFKARWNVDANETKLDFAIILFVGMIVFGIFSEIVNRAPTLIISNSNYVKKVIFPLEILPWVSLGTILFHSFISLIVLLLVQFFVNGNLPWTIFLFPLILLPLIFAGLGSAWFLASLGVYIRDVGQITSVFTTILMFVSTVFYPITALPKEYQFWLSLNPLVLIITESRNVLVFGILPDWLVVGKALLIGVTIFMLGFAWFQKTRRGFADVL